MPATESLLFPSTLRMYGRVFDGLEIKNVGPLAFANNDLQRQLIDEDKNTPREDLRLARIYGFVYEGSYYELPEPCLFIVRGDGLAATDPEAALGFVTDMKLPDDFKMWQHDKSDQTIRINLQSGSFEETMMMLMRAGAGLQSGFGHKVQAGFGHKVQAGFGHKVIGGGHRSE